MRGVTARAAAAGSMLSVLGSTSTNTGRAPACRIASAEKAAEIEVVTTSSPGPTAARAQREVDRVGAVAHRDRVARAQRLRQLALEGLALRAEDEPARVEHAPDGAVELAAQRRHVGLEVDEGDVRAHR